MVAISIETLGEERFVRAFNRVSADVRDFREPFEDVWADFVQMEERVFAQRGPGWAALSPAYAAWKERNFPGQPLMRLHDRLFNSLTARDQTDAQDTVKDIRETEARFGTRVEYALAHQMGIPGRLPQRKVVNLQEEDKRRWGRIFQRWFIALFRREGL